MAEETRATAAWHRCRASGGRRSPVRRPAFVWRSASGVRRVPAGPVAAAKVDANIFRRKKVCKFCVEKIEAINYKDVRLLAQFVAESGKIVPRRLTGVCTPHQRRLSLGHQAGAQHRAAAVCRTRIVKNRPRIYTDLHGSDLV